MQKILRKLETGGRATNDGNDEYVNDVDDCVECDYTAEA